MDALHVRPLRFSTKKTALTQIVNCFWYKLSADVICKESVKSFKSKLDLFRLKVYKENRICHLWEFSDDVYNRVEVNVNNRIKCISFIQETPLITKRKKVNLKVFSYAILFVFVRCRAHSVVVYRYPIVARARCLAQPLGRVRARAKVSCIQTAWGSILLA